MKAEILKMVWKLLRPIIEDALKDVLKTAIDRLTAFISNLQRERSEQAKQKADAAAVASREKADSDPIEAARQAGRQGRSVARSCRTLQAGHRDATR